MRYIRYFVLAALAISLIVIALANRQIVTLQLLPVEMAGFMGFSWSIALPLFLVIFAGILAGVLIGFVWEWLREHKHRAEASRQRRQKEDLQRELASSKVTTGRKGDDVLAILDASAPSR